MREFTILSFTAFFLLLLNSTGWVRGQTDSNVPRNFTLNLDGTILGVAWDPPPDLSVSSYTLTCYVSGSEVLSLETSLVNVTLGVYMTSATYSCNVYATTSSGEGHPTDDLSVTTGDARVEAYLPFIPRVSDENIITAGDDIAIESTIVTFPFGGTSFTVLYVGSNGVISFGSSYDDYINREFTSTFREYLVAPFWDDININNGGTISYEIFESGYYLEQVNAYIQRKRPTDFEGTWMMNVYYKEVSPFAGDGENTFQTILVTDEIYSYAILVYKCGLMEWDSSANIGYTANGDRFDNHDPSSRDVACENSPDSDWNNVIYLLSDANPEDQPPMDIASTDVTSNSARISWRVESMSVRQEYVVNYGTSEDSLDSQSATVQSVTDLSAVNRTYEVDLTGLTLGTTYYHQVVATSGDFTLESDTASFTTLELPPSAAPENFEAMLEDTVLTFTWDPPSENEQNGVISSYFLSCSISSELQFEFNLTSIQEISVGVYEIDSTYTCEISASTSAGEGPTTSQTVTTGGVSTNEYLPFIPLGALHDSNETFLEQIDDVSSDGITTPDFPFFDSVQNRVTVGSNGVISFGASNYNAYQNADFPGPQGVYMVAPYWADINTVNGGNISYEMFESGYFLEQVNAFLLRTNPTDFEGTWMLVASYDSVAPYDGTGANTFQVIIITDETYSFTIFTYKCGLLEWDNGVNIGYSADRDPYENYNPSSIDVACENSPNSEWNNVVYLLSDDNPDVTIADATASDIGTSTTEVSWVVPFIPEQIEFTVYYGTNEDSLDGASDTVTSSADTSLTDQEYSVTLTGLRLGVSYYFKVVGTYSDFTVESDVGEFTTNELAPSGAPVNFTASLNGTIVLLTWKPPSEDERNGAIISYFLSCDIDSNPTFDLNLTTIEQLYLGVYKHESDYSCDIYAATLIGGGPTASVSFRTGAYSTPAYLPFIPLGVLYENSNAVNLSVGDDVESSAITLPTSLPFGETNQTTAYVGSNGIISFGSSAYNPFVNVAFSSSSRVYVLAPFWDDIDIETSGVITYEIFESGYFLERVSDFIRRKRPTSFEGTWMLVASYKKVYPFFGSGENTFQAVVVSDGDYSYAVFTYKCGLMNWDDGATIGYSAFGDPYDNHDPSSSDVACVNTPDSEWNNVVYKLSESGPEDPPAEDVSISNITGNSAVVSWTVASISSPQDYVVEYGEDEGSLTEMSETRSVSDTSLTDQMYSVTLSGLTQGILYYVRVATTNAGNVTFYSETISFRTVESAPTGAPRNFAVSIEKTTLTFVWDPPANDEIGGTLISYTLACTDDNDSDNGFEVDLKVIEKITVDEFLPSTDYTCTIYASTNGGDGPTASVSASTDNSTDIYLQFLDLDTILDVNKVTVPRTDDRAAGPISISTGFPFGDTNQTQLHVGSNGIISFGNSSYNPFGNSVFPITGEYVVAPYWDDIDTRFGNGSISYEIHNSGFYLDQVNTFITRQRLSDFRGTWMAVIFYDSVRPYPAASSTEENSFQVILITDGTYSYSVFTYNCDLMEWDDGVTIGLSGGSSFYENHDPSSSDVACLNLPDSNWTNVIYLLSSDSLESSPPSDIELSMLRTDSVNVSWTIPSLMETEEYIVQYGIESDNFNLTSSSVESVTNTTLVNQTYSVVIDNLDMGTVYYVRILAQYGIDDLFKRYSDITAFRTLEEEQTAYLPFLNHTDTYITSGVLDSCDDCASQNITLPDDFPFGQYIHQNVFVGIDGWIAFGRSIEDAEPEIFPTTSANTFWTYIVAPFWGDLSTVDGGMVSWEIHNASLSPGVFNRVNAFIRNEFGDSNFDGTWMIICFWEDVLASETLSNNTFQGVLVTNSTKSYAIFTYKCGELDYSDEAVIGYNVPLGNFENHPLSYADVTADTIGCVHLDSVWNNVVYDLQPDGSTIFISTPEPSDFIGSCIDAGHTECCIAGGCTGTPDDCYCDFICFDLGDCCYDIDLVCSNSTVEEYDLLVANGAYIHFVHFEGEDAVTLSSDLFERVSGIDFLYNSSVMFWSDTTVDKIYRANMNGSNVEELINSSILVVDDIAVDWVSDKLYWVDAVWARIEVLDLESYLRAEVLRIGPSTLPRAIAVDPESRFMFWSDWAEDAKIERSFMDGNDRRTVISTSLSQPNGITIDYASQKIYWSDSDLDKIEYSNYDGTSRTTLETAESGLSYPFSLTVTDNLLFWGDWETNKVYVTHKVHGSDPDEGYFATVALFSSSPYGIEALLSSRQQSAENPCDANDCSHICLLNDLEDGFSCVCAEGYGIESDARSCKKLEVSELPPAEGSCLEAGYNSSDTCCSTGHCSGIPALCSCDLECYERGDCCSDIGDSCTEGVPVVPTNITTSDITDMSVNIAWTISSIAIIRESYFVMYGINRSDLDTSSSSTDSQGLALTDQVYSVLLDNLESTTTYYYQVVAENDFSSSSSDMYSFTTLEGVPTGAPVNFTVDVNMTTLICSWDSPPENILNGNITSYTLSCTVDDNTVFNETLSSSADNFSIDFYSPNTTYNCSIYASTEAGDGPASEYIAATTTDDVKFFMVLPFISIVDTYNFDVVTLSETDDGGSDNITIPELIGFPFGNTSQSLVFVGTNGLISFGRFYNSYSNSLFPGSVSDRYLVAPFWDDVDITGGNGEISYEIHDSGYYLDHVSGFIRAIRPSEFQGTWMLVVYWDAVHHFIGTDNPEENTFQAILITDGVYSYTVFTYKCGLMEWDTGATIGFNAANGRYANNDPSSSDIACENIADSQWSNVIFRLSDDNPEYPVPDNVEVSDISETSVVVSWTIEYVLEQQEYFLVYGVDEDALHLTSSSVLGHSDISLTNQAYNITLTGLTIGTDYYVAVIAEYGFTFLYSDTISFTTHDRPPQGPPLNYKVIPRGTGLYFRWDTPEGGVRILSYTITCYISSDLAINVTLNPVNSVILDEFMPSTTYTCSLYAASTGGNGPATYSVNVTTEDDTGDVYLPFLSLDAIYGVEQVFLSRFDDGVSGVIDVGGTSGFPFGGTVQAQLYVGTNGLLSFESAYNEFSNQVFPGSSEISSRYLVAPFWDDIDISRDETGQISYEIHQSGYYLDRVNDFLQRKRPSAFSGSWMFVAYWDSVRPYPGSSFTEVNSFQAILITDGTYSYAIFTYDCNRTEWGSSGVTIGYSAASDPYDNYDPSSSDVACLNTPDSNISNVIYQLSDDSPEIPPPDVTELEVALTSVNVSWVVPYLEEEEEYYIIYGLDSDELDMFSDSILSVSDTNLENQTYSLRVEGLDAGTIYFAQVVAAFGTNGEFERYSDIFVFRTKENEQAVYLEFLPHTDTYTDSGTLPACDNCSSSRISLPDDFPFGGYFHDSAYVSTNGLISFGRRFTGSSPEIFPPTTSDVFWRYIAAVFWADWDILSSGSVSWETHTDSESKDLLKQVDNLIQMEYGDTNFTGTWMLVSFWENVSDSDGLFENTFQGILATNGTKSYAVYTYKCGELYWSDDATIGANAPPADVYYNHPLTLIDIPPDEIACVHLESVWNNVIIDLEPNPVILPSTPEPSRFIGSCAAAGFNECCIVGSCLGFPSDCFCDDFCRQVGDCCYDIDDTCPDGNSTDFDILVANGFYIHQVYFEGNSTYIFDTNSSGTAVGIDFNYEDMYVFWSDIENDVIYRAELDGTTKEVLVNTDINVVDDIAIDWVSDKLYWVDAAWARIEVLDLSTRYRAEVLRIGPNTNPRAIAVEPYRRFMFWTDWGEVAKIEQSFMDGSGRRTIVDSDLSQPNAVTVDYLSEKIYWADSDLDKIEYANYDGSERMLLETEETGLLYPFGLTVAGDVLFWSDWGSNAIYATHKQHGADTSEGYFAQIAVFTSIPYGIEALDADRQQPANNTCDGVGCSHVCVLSDIGFRCLCPDGYSLESDQLQCKEDDTSGSGGALLEGSCVDAGYNDSCCQHGYCAGYPFTCFCDRECYARGDCCDGIEDVCPEGAPTLPTNVMVTDITSRSAMVVWTIPRVAFTIEKYRVYYGNSADALSMKTEALFGADFDAINVMYTITLSGLEPVSTYYIRVVSANSESNSSTAIRSFTTAEDVPSGAPSNFTISVSVTSFMCTWNLPDETLRNGEIISYTLACTSGDETVVNLTLRPTVLEITMDLFSPLTSYSCSVAASTAAGIGPYTDAIIVVTQDSGSFTYLPFIPLSVEYGSSAITLPESDDGISNVILLPNISFPFGDSLQTQFYVGTNGLISFDEAYNSPSNQAFPGSVSSRYLVAPFWGDVNTEGGNGTISYEIYESGYFLDHVGAFLRQRRPSTFQGTWMTVAYWDAVHSANSSEENTFQAILVTDGISSYAVFTYKCGLLEWGNGATIGFNTPGWNYNNHEPSDPDIGCVNQPVSIWSNVVYLLSNSSSEFEAPGNVVVSDITEESALVSWRVPSVPEPQEYYLSYGTNQNNLTYTTDRVQGNSNASQMYSISLQNLESGTVYYLVVVSEFGTTSLYSDIESFTTLEPAPDGPPLNLSVTVLGVSLTILWQPPAGDQVILYYTVACSVAGITEFSTKLKPVLEITLDQLMPSTDYSCSVFASSSGGDGPPTNDIIASAESITINEVYLPFIPMDTLYGVDEIFLEEANDGISDAISIPIGFPFGETIQNQLYVGTNGLLSFGSAFSTGDNVAFPDFVRYLVAPYWDNVDTGGGNGKISYEIHQAGHFLDQVNTYLNRKKPSEFQGTWMAVVLYDAVHPHVPLSDPGPEENTFQAILITDGTYSYAIFIYNCGLMEWDNGVTIGFNAAGDPYANNVPSSSDVACANMAYTNWSNVEYLLSNESPELPVPQDVYAVELTTETAVISWTIPSFIRPETYYVQYGTEDTVLDMTSSPILSVTNTSLVNQTYSLTLQGLNPSTTYSVRVVAVYDIISARYSDLLPFRTYDQEQVIYLPFLNHTTTYISSGQLQPCDDCSSVEIVFPEDLPFGGYFHQSAYVQTNGLISFGRSTDNSVPVLFPSESPEIYWSYLLAPFWADVDTTHYGSVSWELHNIENSPQLLDRVNAFIQTLEGVNFNGTWMLVAFWEDVDLYANTFQALVVTDGINSYSVYTYKCGQLSWPDSATIGFNAPLMDYVNDPYSGNSADSIACTHLLSPWNNIVYDLQPGSVILPTTPEPSNFIGSCVDAGYTGCCEGDRCAGSPNDCFCDNVCVTLGDCCYDYTDICPNITARVQYDLLVATGPSLVTVDYQGSDASSLYTNFSENTLAVDFDYKNSKVYWSHTDLDYNIPAKIYCANLDGSQEQVLVDTNILFVSDIAVDWVGGHLYWVDSSWARIEALDFNNFNRTEILRTGPNTNPSAIAVDPLRRYMFWSDLGVSPHIERAFMDGSDRRVIIGSGISSPVSITIDYSEQRIYWADVDLNRLEYCDYNGLNCFIVESEPSGLLYPYALTVANDLLFWTDWITDSVYATHKENGSSVGNGYFQKVATFSSDPYGIEALLENRQEPGENPCENSSCSHLCLLSGTDDRGYVCVCSEGYQLEPDGFTCEVFNDSGITPPAQGSCVIAGYTSCCTNGYCSGYPPTCFCHPDCTLGTMACCDDFANVCPAVPPLQPADVTASVYTTSARLYWTVERPIFGFETYSVAYGLAAESLSMQSAVITGSSLQNTTYTVQIENLQPGTAYYYRIIATNLAGVTHSEVGSFTTQTLSTSSVLVPLESTVTLSRKPETTETTLPPQSTYNVPSTSTPTSMNTVLSLVESHTTSVYTTVPTSYSSIQSRGPAYSSTAARTTPVVSVPSTGVSTQTESHTLTESSTQAGPSVESMTIVTRLSTRVMASSQRLSASVAATSTDTAVASERQSMSTGSAVLPSRQSTMSTTSIILPSQQPSSSLLATPSSQRQATSELFSASITPLTAGPSQTTVPSVGATTTSRVVASTTIAATMEPTETATTSLPVQPSATSESTKPIETPIETKIPPTYSILPSQEPSSSLLATPSSQQQATSELFSASVTPLTAGPSQTTVPSVGATTISRVVASTTIAATMEPTETATTSLPVQPSATSESTKPIETPIETKIPPTYSILPSQEPSSSLLATPSSQRQATSELFSASITPLTAGPSQTTVPSVGATTTSRVVASTTIAATMEPTETATTSLPVQPRATSESTKPIETPVETKVPSIIEEHSVKVTIADYDKNFNASAKQRFKTATAESVTEYCTKNEDLCHTFKLKRSTLVVKSDGVKIREISETSAGITLVIYVLIDGSEILNRDSLLAAIQSGSDIYKMYNFTSVTAERSSDEKTEDSGGGLSDGAIAGVVVCVLFVIVAVLITAAIILYRMRKRGSYSVKALVGGYDDPITDKLFEFESSVHDDNEKKSPVYEEGKL